MRKEFINVAYALLDLTENVVTFGPETIGMTAEGMAMEMPYRFWLENDIEGRMHLCTVVAVGTAFPKMVTDTASYNAHEFVTVDVLKQDGDRPWHPTTKPPRPFLP